MVGSRNATRALVVTAAILTFGGAAYGQFGRAFRGQQVATPNDFDGRFHYCRAFYQSVGFGGSWTTDYPNADINLSIRLSELTRTNVSKTPGGDPKPLIVRLDGEELFQCPLVILSAPGSVSLTQPETVRLREYFLKGGIVWTDDSWGSGQWERWENEIRKVLPAASYPIIDLPLTHSLFRMQFQITEIPQIPNIGFYLRSGGRTSEQGADSATPMSRPSSTTRGASWCSTRITPTSPIPGSARPRTPGISTRSAPGDTPSRSIASYTRTRTDCPPPDVLHR